MSGRADGDSPDASDEPGIPVDSGEHSPNPDTRAARHLALGVRLPRPGSGRGHLGHAPPAPSAGRGQDGLRPAIMLRSAYQSKERNQSGMGSRIGAS